MLKTDRMIIKAAKALTDNMHDELQFDPSAKELQVVKDYHTVIRSTPLDISSDIYLSSMSRLLDEGYFRVSTKYSGGFFVQITDRIVLAKEYWWDNFTRRFIFGYVSGFVSGAAAIVVGELLVAFLRAKLGI